MGTLLTSYLTPMGKRAVEMQEEAIENDAMNCNEIKDSIQNIEKKNDSIKNEIERLKKK